MKQTIHISFLNIFLHHQKQQKGKETTERDSNKRYIAIIIKGDKYDSFTRDIHTCIHEGITFVEFMSYLFLRIRKFLSLLILLPIFYLKIELLVL